MAQVILFGGGDAGGIVVTAAGARRIPPFDPGLLLQIRGLSALTQSSLFAREHQEPEVATLINKIANYVVGRVESVVGELDDDNSLIYADDDGGFACGSSGKPPVPFPPRGASVPPLGALLSRGVISPELLEFVGAANANDISLREVLAGPTAVAAKLDLRLNDRTLRELSLLSPANAEKISDPVSREIVHFFATVVDDGRFIDNFASEPFKVSDDLGIHLSDEALDRIIAGGSSLRTPGSVMNPIGVAVMVGIVIMLVTDVAMVDIDNIVDESGIQKL